MRVIYATAICVLCFASSVHANSLKGLLDDVKQRNSEEKKEVRESKRGNRPREHYNDPYRVLREEKRSAYASKCNIKDFKKFPEYSKCFDAAMGEYRTDFPDRGSHEYSEKYYSALSKQQAEEKREELLNLLDRVSFYARPENEKVELLVDHLLSEITYIERYVMEIPPRDYRPLK